MDPIIGTGRLFYQKTARDSDTEIWQGDLVLSDGRRMSLEARAPAGKKRFNYECTMKEKTAPGIPWPVKATFKLKPFGGKINVAQDVEIPNYGQAKVWVKKGQNGPFIAFRMLDKPAVEHIVR